MPEKDKLQKQPTAKAKKVEDSKDGMSSSNNLLALIHTFNIAKYWARGTGYGHGHTNKVDWDVQAYLAAQKQKDRETQSIIEGLQ